MTTLTFKVPDAEAAMIRRQAKQAGITVSEFIRLRIGETSGTRTAERKQEYAVCEYTGARIFKGQPGDIPLGTESIKEMLADFP